MMKFKRRVESSSKLDKPDQRRYTPAPKLCNDCNRRHPRTEPCVGHVVKQGTPNAHWRAGES